MRSGVFARLVPFRDALERALALASEAALAPSDEEPDPAERRTQLETRIRSEPSDGALLDLGEGPVGIALWDRPGPLGLAVRVLFLAPRYANSTRYRQFLEAIGHERGPVTFLPGDLPGLPREELVELFRGLGFAPYSRSEMIYPEGRAPPDHVIPAGADVRPFRPEDGPGVAQVHAAAYVGRFDRYLFLEDLVPARDALAIVRALVRGHWGEFLPWASMVATDGGRPVAATLTVRTPRGALIADVATDPVFSRRGFGRAVVSSTVRALRLRGERTIRLVVTEGNRTAIRLYERIGFLRHLGPSEAWYDPRRIPFAPEES